jgi:dihydroorotate dehydrogenase
VKRLAARALAGASLPVLRRLDPERAHGLGLAGLGWVRSWWPPPEIPSALRVTCFGMQFSHPLGLAAGFDKNADHADALGAVGFSHIEFGTVTPRPQPGNPKPRMFRFPRHRALVNRMGFNNKGAEHLLERLARSRFPGVRGISIGKNFDTPLERAEEDYVVCLRKVYAQAGYVAVNVSSPNTARLRELQAPDGLQRILGALLAERRSLIARHGRRVPLLVKVAPDLDEQQVTAIAAELRVGEVDGVIATNTSSDLQILGRIDERCRGGMSGAPLHERSLRVIAQLRRELGAGFPIVGVGGIMNADSALATLQAGANLLQIYTGFAYRGAALIEEILDALSRRTQA